MDLPETTSPGLTLLQGLAARLPRDRIDRVWLFPTYRLGEVESTVAVLSAFHDDLDRRRVLTATLTSRRRKRAAAEITESLHENAITPAERVGAVVNGVIHRLADEIAAAPTEAHIDGDPARWDRFLADLTLSPSRPAPHPSTVARGRGIRYQ